MRFANELEYTRHLAARLSARSCDYLIQVEKGTATWGSLPSATTSILLNKHLIKQPAESREKPALTELGQKVINQMQKVRG